MDTKLFWQRCEYDISMAVTMFNIIHHEYPMHIHSIHNCIQSKNKETLVRLLYMLQGNFLYLGFKQQAASVNTMRASVEQGQEIKDKQLASLITFMIELPKHIKHDIDEKRKVDDRIASTSKNTVN